MRMTVLALAMLAGCGGGSEPEPDDMVVFRAQAMEWAETLCKPNGGVRRVLDEFYSHSRNGTLIDVGLECRCRNGHTIRTPMRHD